MATLFIGIGLLIIIISIWKSMYNAHEDELDRAYDQSTIKDVSKNWKQTWKHGLIITISLIIIYMIFII